MYSNIEREDEDIYLCKDCLVEVEYNETDIDSYFECPSCNKENFTWNLEIVNAKKIKIIHTIETIEFNL